jgi:hypothetical protein
VSNTPRYGHAPITMRRPHNTGGDDPDESLEQLGDFNWQFDPQGRRTLVVLIPCARGDRTHWTYSRWTIDHKNHCDAQWSWDGNEDAPTLNPSLHAVGVWHGWVRGGQLVEA